MQNKDAHLTTHYAQHAFKYGIEQFGKDSKNTIMLAINWANAYDYYRKDHTSPAPMIKEHFRGFKRAAGGDPAILMDLNLAFGSALFEERTRHSYKKDTKIAVNIYDDAIKNAKIVYQDNEAQLAQIKFSAAQKLYTHSNLKKSKSLFLEAIKFFESHRSEYRNKLAIANFWLAQNYLALKDKKNARKAMTAALEVFDKSAPNSQIAAEGHAFMKELDK